LKKAHSIAVVIPARNAVATIEGAIRAALNQRGVTGVEVFVVDDGSTDGTGDAARKFGARVIRLEGSGPAAARNAGWRAAKTEAVAFTDSDCIPNPDWCERILDVLEDKTVGAVGGSYDIANPSSLLARIIHVEILARHQLMPSDVHALGTYNFAARRELLEQLGGFDESYTAASGEDNDISYRILKAGRRLVFLHDNTVSHFHPTRLVKYLRSQAKHGFWRVKLYLDHPTMTAGDDYSHRSDFAAPFLGLGSLMFLALAVLFAVCTACGQWTRDYLPAKAAWGLAVIFFALAAACGRDLMVRIHRLGYKSEARVFPFFNAARAMARGLGMLAGIFHFGLMCPRRKS